MKRLPDAALNPNLDPRLVARGLYWQGWKISAIGRQLGIKPATVHSWKQRENWDGGSPVQRVAASIEARLIQLIGLPQKSDGDFREIRQLNALLTGRPSEKGAEKADAPFSDGLAAPESRACGVIHTPPAIDKPPREKKARPDREPRERKTRAVEKPKKNWFAPEQFQRMQEIVNEQQFDYQRAWGRAYAHTRFRNILKSRQIGATFYFAREAFITALKTGRNQIFLSASRAQAFQFKQYMVDLAAMVDVELNGDAVLLPNSGATLYFLGTNSRTAQGRHGDLYVDEYFWIPDFKRLQTLAEPMAAQKQYHTTFFSTPSSEAHPAFTFWNGEDYNEERPASERIKLDLSHAALKNGRLDPDGQWRQIVTIHDAEAQGCTLFDIEYLRKRNPPSKFAQLFECQFVADGEAVFDFKTLQACGVDSWDAWADFYKPYAARPCGARPVWVGYDPNHTGDAAGLVVALAPKSAGDKFRIVEKHLLPGADFETQAGFIRKLLERYNVEKIVIDANGVGAAVGELVRKFFPAAVCMTYSPEIKGLMVLKTQNLMRHGRIEWDSGDIDMQMAFLSVRRAVTASGRYVTYESGRSLAASHGDLAWAAMMVFFQEPLDGQVGGGVVIEG
ncbi:MAG: terminase family protein [Neisseria sp.]|nr:terminase family protein [Neisseria sp.]